jgi:hypothetical protein
LSPSSGGPLNETGFNEVLSLVVPKFSWRCFPFEPYAPEDEVIFETGSRPEDFFAASLDALRAVKPKWKTSIGVMIKRAKQLHLISEDVERKLWINYSRHKWRRFEPYDDALPVEEPTLLRHAIQLLMESRDQTPDDISSRVGLSLSDVEALCGLQPGYLSGSFSKVSKLPDVEEGRPAAQRGTGSVIDLTPRLSGQT